MTSPADKGAPGEGGPYIVERVRAGRIHMLDVQRVVIGLPIATVGSFNERDRGEAEHWRDALNSAHELGARAAEQIAAGVIRQLGAEIATARKRIDQLEAERANARAVNDVAYELGAGAGKHIAAGLSRQLEAERATIRQLNATIASLRAALDDALAGGEPGRWAP